MFEKHSYKDLSGESSLESDRPFLDDAVYRSSLDGRAKARKSLMHWTGHGISALAIVGLLIYTQVANQNTQSACWDRFNFYSPVNDAVVPHPYTEKMFNGSLWHQTPWTGPPTEEVEKAWYDIMKYGMISVTKEDILKVKHPDWSAQFPEESGGGYIAATIGTHQLHCLHYIWQDHYMEYFPKTQDKKKMIPELYERHYEHCVDYIRQSLMCQFDTGIIPYNWVLDHQNPTPNGLTHHKCVDWSKLQDWLKVRAVDVPDNFTWTQPADAVRLSYNP
ncbi:hypothetical protein F5B22DRAFT_624261 [Xylaria bambusicola]|uniref:uncharacterized protein n=1 Tax=Xylaria bambusicola TaxID=326684 RepID=UPI002007FA0D|nr:uncharacterized protein F5B22DRAFT_624261 [Xylaria bambusicola]KAI0506268.1 hypothetical protein F5B22DRAFT_624261 [Xylaria bambusicola]